MVSGFARLGDQNPHVCFAGHTDVVPEGEIELIENLGNEKIVYMKKDNYLINAKIANGIEIKNQIGFMLNDIFIFNENGQRIKS